MMMVRQILHHACKFSAAITVAAVLLLANFPFPCSLSFLIENLLSFGMIFVGCFLLIALGESCRLICKQAAGKAGFPLGHRAFAPSAPDPQSRINLRNPFPAVNRAPLEGAFVLPRVCLTADLCPC